MSTFADVCKFLHMLIVLCDKQREIESTNEKSTLLGHWKITTNGEAQCKIKLKTR